MYFSEVLDDTFVTLAAPDRETVGANLNFISQAERRIIPLFCFEMHVTHTLLCTMGCLSATGQKVLFNALRSRELLLKLLT